MLKTFTHAALALTMALGLSVSSAHNAEARRGVGTGIAAGIIGLGILGAYAHARDRDDYYRSGGGECFRGPRECHWSGRRCFENEWGDTVCRGGDYVCERPLICD